MDHIIIKANEKEEKIALPQYGIVQLQIKNGKIVESSIQKNKKYY